MEPCPAETMCPICQSSIESQHVATDPFCCSHSFHRACVLRWLQTATEAKVCSSKTCSIEPSTCPVCRSTLDLQKTGRRGPLTLWLIGTVCQNTDHRVMTSRVLLSGFYCMGCKDCSKVQWVDAESEHTTPSAASYEH